MPVESLNHDNITSPGRGLQPAGVETCPQYLTVPDVARALQIEETNVLTLLEAGAIPFVRVSPGEVRIHREGLEDWRFAQEMSNFKPTR